MIGLSVMHRRFVCVTGYKAVYDVLNNQDMDSRIDSFDFNLRTGGLRRGGFNFYVYPSVLLIHVILLLLLCTVGVLMTDGDLWKEQRRFTLRHLKDLGFGKSSLEAVMLDEIQDFIDNLQVGLSVMYHYHSYHFKLTVNYIRHRSSRRNSLVRERAT